jgi:hypothetical protein
MSRLNKAKNYLGPPYSIDGDSFLHILKEYESMPNFKRIVLIDITLYNDGIFDQIHKGMTDQTQLWLDFARRFDSAFHGYQLRLLIGSP